MHTDHRKGAGPTQACRLSLNGAIGTQETVVTSAGSTGWAKLRGGEMNYQGKHVIGRCAQRIVRGLLTFCLVGALLAIVASAQSGSSTNGSKLDVQTIYLARHGCQPAQVRHAPGPFWLHVVNLSHNRNLALVLRPENGAAVSSKQITDSEWEWTQEVNLPAGKHIIAATNSTDFSCTILIQ